MSFLLVVHSDANSIQVHNTHIGTAKATKKTKDRIGDS